MTIGDMVTSQPAGSSPVSGGDDEIRGIKLDLADGAQGSFPNIGSVQVVATADEMNDQAQKSKAETITGIWSYEATMILGEDRSFVGTNGASNPVLVRVNVSNEVELGDTTEAVTRLQGVTVETARPVNVGNTLTANTIVSNGNVTVTGELRSGEAAPGTTGLEIGTVLAIYPSGGGIPIGFIKLFQGAYT